jgi:hypothetical protein
MSGFCILCSKKVYVDGVSVRHRVRCDGLISLRKSSPSHTIFRVHYSSLDRRRIAFRATMLTLRISVSFQCVKQTSRVNCPILSEVGGKGDTVQRNVFERVVTVAPLRILQAECETEVETREKQRTETFQTNIEQDLFEHRMGGQRLKTKSIF